MYIYLILAKHFSYLPFFKTLLNLIRLIGRRRGRADNTCVLQTNQVSANFPVENLITLTHFFPKQILFTYILCQNIILSDFIRFLSVSVCHYPCVRNPQGHGLWMHPVLYYHLSSCHMKIGTYIFNDGGNNKTT